MSDETLKKPTYEELQAKLDYARKIMTNLLEFEVGPAINGPGCDPRLQRGFRNLADKARFALSKNVPDTGLSSLTEQDRLDAEHWNNCTRQYCERCEDLALVRRGLSAHSEKVCAGPHADARDCPVHDPRKQTSDVDEVQCGCDDRHVCVGHADCTVSPVETQQARCIHDVVRPDCFQCYPRPQTGEEVT